MLNSSLDDIVFAFGSGRSGTTLLAKLIDSSGQILYRHEPDQVAPTEEIPFLPEPDAYGQYLEASRGYLGNLLEQRVPTVSCTQPVFHKRFRSGLQNRLLEVLLPALGYLGKTGLRLPAPDLTGSGSFRPLIKSVNSVVRVPMFAQAVPGMKFIHIVRHPGAVVASALRGIELNKMSRNNFVESVSRLAIAQTYSLSPGQLANATFEEQNTYVWMVQNDKTYQEMKDNPNYMLVFYEDLCVNMHQRVADICRFIGIDFESQMQAFIDSMSGVNRESGYFSVIKNPLSNIRKWEKQIDPPVIERILAVAGASGIGRLTIDSYNSLDPAG